MPELPEVETIVRYMNRSSIVGVPIEGVDLLHPKIVEGLSDTDFVAGLKGCRIERFGRRGKWIWAALSNEKTLLIHLRMTGNLRISKQGAPERHDCITLDFKNGSRLHYRDVRRFGCWKLVSDPQEAFSKLGPEPLGESLREIDFRCLLAKYSRQIKPLLMDQKVLAGLGNIYANEALFASSIHPLQKSNQVSKQKAKKLYHAIRKILRQAIESQGTSLGDTISNYAFAEGQRGRNQLHLQVYQRPGSDCPLCGTKIEKIIVGQRSTYYCPDCQRI